MKRKWRAVPVGEGMSVAKGRRGRIEEGGEDDAPPRPYSFS